MDKMTDNTQAKYSFLMKSVMIIFLLIGMSQQTSGQAYDGLSLSRGIIIASGLPETPEHTHHVAYTSPQSTGNRLIQGKGHFPDTQLLDIKLKGDPRWLVALPTGEGSVWVTVLEDGQIQAFQIQDRTVEPITTDFPRIPITLPPVLNRIDGQLLFLLPPSSKASQLTHPILFNDRTLTFIETNGDLVFWNEREVARLPIHALPDARTLTDGHGRLLVLTDPSERYKHSILGDALEATGIALIETRPKPRVIRKITIPAPQVIEGLAPIWADLNGDGMREIIVTLSDAQNGSQIVAYTEHGELLAAGPPIGQGNRWRHQLVVAPFGLHGEIEFADILTPHIGGIVEFYRLVGDKLEIVTRVPGYSSHVIGSRNLDTTLAGDFDDDENIELLVPNQAFRKLAAIQRVDNGAQVVWTLPIGGRMSTNLASVELADGTLILGVGHKGRKLRLWLP